MSEWQPIETAPKDGSLFLGWATWPEDPPDFYLCSYSPSLGFSTYDVYENLVTPTHWMPLPLPPSEQPEEPSPPPVPE
jgi:hypothetical protein